MNTSPFKLVDLTDARAVQALVVHALGNEPDRLAHVLKVAAEVQETARLLVKNKNIQIDLDLAYRAALLHDIGYAEELVDTGFHPIDGARFVEAKGFPDIAAYIICHSNSPEQALLKGLPEVLVSRHIIADLITYWDVQVLQGGRVVSYEERLADIRSRYGEESPVWLAHMQAAPRIESILDSVDALLEIETKD